MGNNYSQGLIAQKSEYPNSNLGFVSDFGLLISNLISTSKEFKLQRFFISRWQSRTD
jgi:hypothetical protein